MVKYLRKQQTTKFQKKKTRGKIWRYSKKLTNKQAARNHLDCLSNNLWRNVVSLIIIYSNLIQMNKEVYDCANDTFSSFSAVQPFLVMAILAVPKLKLPRQLSGIPNSVHEHTNIFRLKRHYWSRKRSAKTFTFGWCPGWHPSAPLSLFSQQPHWGQ